MDARQLRHFLAVAETLHFGRAAASLGMTQPPLSQSIQELERELGTAVFIRTKRSVALTPFGAAWLPHVRAAIERLSGLADIAYRLIQGEEGQLDLSFVSTADYSILPNLVRRYTALYPAVEISLTEATSDIQIRNLADGRSDAGIIIGPQQAGPPLTLAYRPLVIEPLIAAVPESWIAEKKVKLTRNRLSPEAVVKAPLIIFPKRTAPAFHDLVIGYYADHGSRAHIVQEAIQMQTIISLVSAGMGIALVPDSLRNLARTGVRYVQLAAEPARLETGIIWRSDDRSLTLASFLTVTFETIRTVMQLPRKASR